MASDAAARFWQRSLELYRAPGVEAACLGLQDRLGLDVNLLLFCCWTGAEGRRLEADEIIQAITAVAPWQDEVVRPLRAARRRLKSGYPGMPAGAGETLRRRLSEIEIECERVEQARLAALAGEQAPGDPSAPAAIANLERYLRALGRRAQPPDRRDLATLVTCCFPATDRRLVDAAFCD